MNIAGVGARSLGDGMLASADAAEGMRDLLAQMPDKRWIRMHGSYRYPVYPGWKKGPQIQEDMHILFVRGGEGSYRMEDGAIIPLKRGSLVCVSNDYPYRASMNPADPLLISGLRFGVYGHDRGARPYTAPKPFYVYAAAEDADRCDEMTGRIHAVHHGEHGGGIDKLPPLLVHQLLYDLYLPLLGKRIAPSKELSGIQKTKQYIESRAGGKLSIESVAARAGMSARYLQKRFKAEFGMSPKSYHLMVQMDYAYKALSEYRLKVAEVAAQLGYSDAYTFSHQFKKHWGLAPSFVKRQAR